MRINQANRILMNEADGSSGNGAPAAAPAAPAPAAEPTAQPLDVDAIVARITGVLEKKIEATVESKHNAAFAKLRKDGQLKKDEPTTPAPSPSPAAAGLSMADVEAMLERERVITRVATEHKLSDAQVKRMKNLLSAEKPEDVSTWVSSFVTDMGFVRPTTDTSTTITAPVQPQPSGPPLSDKGSPAPGGVVNWEREFAENPGFMSSAAKAAMDAKYGVEKARRMRIDAVNAPGGQAERLRVVTKQG